MSQFKVLQPKTGVRIIPLKIPKKTTSYELVISTIFTFKIDDGMDYELIHLPFPCKVLGTLNKITEDLWETIVEYGMDTYGNFGYKNYMATSTHMFPYPFETATESGMSFFEANEIFTKNPIGDDPCKHNHQCYDSCQGSCWNESDIDFDEWETAEQKTGNWMLLLVI